MPASSTGAASTMPTAASNFSFAEVPAMTTCGNATISWRYTGPSQELSLFVSNRSATPPLVLPLIAYSIAATANAYTWNPVNVTPGVYDILAVGQGVASVSTSFVVSSGNTSSCLPSSLSFPTNAHSPMTSSSQPLPTSDKPSRIGAIVGGVVGGLVFLVALVGVCIYLGFRGRAVPAYRWRSFKSAGRASLPGRWSGLSSHVRVCAQDASSSPQPDPLPGAASAVKGTAPLATLPRLEPNRRKPSCSLSAIPMAEIPNPAPSAWRSAPLPVAQAMLVDKELPHRPTSLAPTIDGTCATRTFDTADAASVVWLRRYSSVATPTRRPSSASAVPSSATSQMYRVRDSMWTASFGAHELPDPASPDGWSVHRGARHLMRTKSMRELTGTGDVPPLPTAEA